MQIYQFSNSIYGDGEFCVSDNVLSRMQKISRSVCEKMILDLLENSPSIITFSKDAKNQVVSLKSNRITNFSIKSGKDSSETSKEEIENRIDDIVEDFVSSKFGSYLCIIFED